MQDFTLPAGKAGECGAESRNALGVSHPVALIRRLEVVFVLLLVTSEPQAPDPSPPPFAGRRIANDRKEPCLESGAAFVRSAALEHLLVNRLENVFGIVWIMGTAAQSPSVAHLMVLFELPLQFVFVHEEAGQLRVAFTHILCGSERGFV